MIVNIIKFWSLILISIFKYLEYMVVNTIFFLLSKSFTTNVLRRKLLLGYHHIHKILVLLAPSAAWVSLIESLPFVDQIHRLPQSHSPPLPVIEPQPRVCLRFQGNVNSCILFFLPCQTEFIKIRWELSLRDPFGN